MNATSIAATVGTRYPLVQAPMAGGPNTVDLVVAVCEAGGLGSIAAAYSSADEIATMASEVRARTSQPFAINLFVPCKASVTPDPGLAMQTDRVLAPFRAELALTVQPLPTTPPPRFDDQFEAVLRAAPRVFSFTFGALGRERVRTLRERGTMVIGTATTPDEADALCAEGVDAVCAQGAEAGGHRGTFLGRFDDALIGTMALVPLVRSRVSIPVIAAGGLMDGRAIRAAMTLGASGVQLGTAFLRCPEAGTPAPHRDALTSEAARITVITRAFSGRPARGIRNRMTDAFESRDVPDFPDQQGRTRDLRATAARLGRTDLMQIWAGQGGPLARALPAGILVGQLTSEAGW